MSNAKLIALHGEDWSLVIEQGERPVPVWRHLGARVDPCDLPKLAELRAPATFSLEGDHAMPVYPVGGMGWFGPETISLRLHDGTKVPIQFDDCEMEASPDCLTIALSDNDNSIELSIAYRLLDGGGLSVETSLTDAGHQPCILDQLASAIFPLAANSREIISWRGRHNAEFVECREPMPEHGWFRELRRGLTGHGGPCGCYVLSEGAGWHSGPAIAMQLAWSGDSRLAIERDDEGFWTCTAEAVLQAGEKILQPGDTYAAPALLIGISSGGRNGAMAQMHGAVRQRLHWPGGPMKPRPIHLNSWEACYFDHDEDRIGELAEAAATIGVERFVLDDGWFSGRNSDRAGLGDWTPDPKKYPNGLKPLADKVRALGMQFGLWVEPEMVNPDSDLCRAHPDWVLAFSERNRLTARNQLVVDMRREDVRDYLFDQLDRLLSDVPIEYLKWDHNRDHAPCGGAAQTEGSYLLLNKLRKAHPKVEIESCAGGGGRIDAGIAGYVHRFWTSDNTDPSARIPMQRGFLAFMPPETMGAHVGASPSHATGRSHPLAYRAAIACQGHFGIELDPRRLDDGEREELARWVEFYKRWRSVIHGGRTVLGEANDGLVWQAQGNGEEWLLWLIRDEHGEDRRAQPVPLPFVRDGGWDVQLLRYAGQSGILTPRPAPAIAGMRDAPQRFTGSWLANAGLPIPSLSAQSALIYHFKSTA